MTEPPQDDPFSKPLGAAPWDEPAQPKAPPTPPGYSAPPPGYPPQQQPGYPPQQQPGYPPQQQPGYPPAAHNPYGYAAPVKNRSWMNIVSLSMVAATIVAPIAANIVGIVFGHLGVSAARRGEADNRGVGVAGLILNYVFAIGLIFGFIALFAWAVVDCANDPYCSGDY